MLSWYFEFMQTKGVLAMALWSGMSQNESETSQAIRLNLHYDCHHEKRLRTMMVKHLNLNCVARGCSSYQFEILPIQKWEHSHEDNLVLIAIDPLNNCCHVMISSPVIAEHMKFSEETITLSGMTCV